MAILWLQFCYNILKRLMDLIVNLKFTEKSLNEDTFDYTVCSKSYVDFIDQFLFQCLQHIDESHNHITVHKKSH